MALTYSTSFATTFATTWTEFGSPKATKGPFIPPYVNEARAQPRQADASFTLEDFQRRALSADREAWCEDDHAKDTIDPETLTRMGEHWADFFGAEIDNEEHLGAWQDVAKKFLDHHCAQKDRSEDWVSMMSNFDIREKAARPTATYQDGFWTPDAEFEVQPTDTSYSEDYVDDTSYAVSAVTEAPEETEAIKMWDPFSVMSAYTSKTAMIWPSKNSSEPSETSNAEVIKLAASAEAASETSDESRSHRTNTVNVFVMIGCYASVLAGSLFTMGF